MEEEEEEKDPLQLCLTEMMSPLAQGWGWVFHERLFEKDLSLHSQSLNSQWWFPTLIPTELQDEVTMMSLKLWETTMAGIEIKLWETTMAGIEMSNHAAAEPVVSAAALSPLQPMDLDLTLQQPMNLDLTLQPMNLDLDFITASSKEASGPSPMGDEVAPTAPQQGGQSRPLPSCTSPSMTELILHPEASCSLAESNDATLDATLVAMDEQENVLAGVLHTVKVRQSKEQLLLRIQSLLAQKNEGQLHVLLNFMESWSTLPKCVEDYYAQAQHSGASGSLVPRSNAQVQHSGSKPYPRRIWMHFRKVRTVTDSNVLARCLYCDKVFQSCSETGGTSHLKRHVLSRHKNLLDRWDLQSCSQPPKTTQKIKIIEKHISLSRKKDSENENEHIELGNNNMEVQPGDMSRNLTDDMEVEPGDMPREPIVDMDVDSAKNVSQSNELYPLIEGSSFQVENIPGNFSMLDAAIGIKESRQNEDSGGDNELNEVDHKDVKVETGDPSRKRKKCASESESEAWLHFTKVLDGSGVVTEGMCKHCGKFLKAHPKTNGTSRLRRHAKDIHGIVLKSRSTKTKKRRVAPTTKAKVAQSSECCGPAPDKVPLPSEVIILEDSGDTVVKISTREKHLIDRINSAPEQEVLVQINDVDIKKKDLESLADSELEDGPPRYLVDKIVDAYIDILKDKKEDDTRAHGRVYIETTKGCQLLSCGDACSIDTRKIYNYGIKYLKHDMIFLPINQNGNHWYLAVINTKKQEVQVLDPRKQFQEYEELKLILKNIEQYLELASNEVQSNSWPDYKLASWKPWKVMDESQIPKQKGHRVGFT